MASILGKIACFLLSSFMIFFMPGTTGAVLGSDQETEALGFIAIEDVYGASKHLQNIKEAPASITVVTDEEIKRYGHRNLTDVVNNMTGFYTYSDRNYEYIGTRGFARLGDYGNRVQQLVDGHTLNDNIYGSFFLGQAFGVDMDLVKQIEFIRGPGSALYGSTAVFGTVNIITKSGRDINGLCTKIEGGSYQTAGATVAYGKEYGENRDLLLSASFLNSKGQDLYYPDFTQTPSVGWAQDADGERARKILVKATFKQLSLLANGVWREKNTSTASYGTLFNDNRSRSIDERIFAEMKWDQPFDARKHLKARIYYDRYRFEGAYPYDYPPVTVNRDEALGQWLGGDVVYDHKATFHHFLLGGDIQYHFDVRQKNYDEDPRTVFLDDSHSFTNGSLYGQNEWDIASWLRLTGGLRFDYYSTFGENLSPRFGLILRPADASTVKLLYGQAFRAPNVFELYYKSSTGASIYRDNPELKPEIVHTWEVVVEQELTPVLKATVSAFHYEAKDLISQLENPDASLQFYNVHRVKSDGLEAGMEMNWPGLAKIHASYSYQDTRDEQTGQWLANSPRHLVKAGAMIPLYRNSLFLGGQCRYMGNRQDRDGDDVGDGTVVDIHLSGGYKGLTGSAGVYNIFDAVYNDPVSADHAQRTIRQNGRNFWFKMGYTF